MRRRIFPVAVLSLITPLAFVALQSRSSTQARAATATLRPPQENAKEQVPDSCPVTKPPTQPFVPPSPYPTQISSNAFWFGTPKLWTSLPTKGRDGLRQKRFWWREGYDWRQDQKPKLKITGKLLDSTAAPILLDDDSNAGWGRDKNHAFIVDAFDVPAPGCWKMTTSYEDSEVSFIVWVTR